MPRAVRPPPAGEPVVTAVVSTYAAERYLRGCLQDLVEQTLGDKLEILVVDACSPENEAAIVREFQRRHGNIRYLRTETRECSSRVFNRAITLARGRYLTTANADDRHRPDFCERMAAVLDACPQYGLVYADSLITQRDNETFAQHTASRRYAWPDYTLATALSCCLFGAQPMWRRSAHALAGEWDPGHPRANDQDMFLRIARRCGAVHLRETLGLFLQRKDSVSGSSNRDETLRDVLAVMKKHRTGTALAQVFPRLAERGDAAAVAAALFEFGNLCARGPYTDAQLALDNYRRALELQLIGDEAAAVRAAFANNSACILACAGDLDRAETALRHGGDGAEAMANRELLAAARQQGRAPQLRQCAFVELPHEVVEDSRRGHAVSIGGGGDVRLVPPRQQLPWDVFDGPDGVPVASPGRGGGARDLLLVMYGWADSGGGTILPRQAAKELAARGHRVRVFYAAARPEPELGPYGLKRELEDGVELFGLCNRPAAFLDLAAPEREIDDPAVRASFAQVLAEVEPELVHFFNLHNLGTSLPELCKARGIATVLSSNNYWTICPRLYLADERLQLCSGGSEDGSKCERCLGQRGTAGAHAARRQAALAMHDQHLDVHLAVSRRVRDLHVQNGCDAARIRVLQQAPPTVDAIWAATGSRRAIVDRLERPLRLGFVGSCLPHKGVHVLAAALQQLPAGRFEAVALGDVGADYREFVRKVDPHGLLHFAGGYPQQLLPQLLSKLDVVVVPSVWEDCAPLVVAEALAARAPVVGSRIGGIPDFVVDGSNGLLFAAGDAAALAGCLRQLIDEPTRLGRLQRAIRPPAGFAAYVDELLAVYGELAPVGEARPVASR